jgi:hypothetical protein
MSKSFPVLCEFRFLCDKNWDLLHRVEGKSDVRFCGDCQKPVFYCDSYDDLQHHIAEAHCVALQVPSDTNYGRMLLGDPRR